MVNKNNIAMAFADLKANDKDLIMFTITNVRLEMEGHQVKINPEKVEFKPL